VKPVSNVTATKPIDGRNESDATSKRNKQREDIRAQVRAIAPANKDKRDVEEREEAKQRHEEERPKAYDQANWTDEQEMEMKRSQKRKAEEAEHFNQKEVRQVQKKAIAREAARRSMSASGVSVEE